MANNQINPIVSSRVIWPHPNQYTLPAATMMQQRQQQNSSKNDARFERSRSLREHILERLEMQQECLDELSERIRNLVTRGQQGANNTNGNSPGDEQIDPKMLASMNETDENGDYYRYGGTSLDEDPIGLDMVAAESQTGRRWRRSKLHIYTPPLMQQMMMYKNGEQVAIDEDPLAKYMRLDDEIRILVQMGTVQKQKQQWSNPYKSLAEQWDVMQNLTKSFDRRLKEILGPADRGGGGPTVSGSGGGGGNVVINPEGSGRYNSGYRRRTSS